MLAEQKKLDFIDAFRGWAILGVILIHAGLYATGPVWLQPFLDQGARGVQLFYIVSAFTLFYSLDTRQTTDAHPVKAFFIRRFFRIAPLFYLVLILSLIFRGLGPRDWAPNGISFGNIIATAVFMNGWHPEWITSIVDGGWSIAVEMNFYLLVPSLHRVIKKVPVAIAALPASYWLGHYVARKIANHYRPLYPSHDSIDLVENWKQILSLPSELYVFFFGILVYLLWKHYGWVLQRVGPHITTAIFYVLTVALFAIFYFKPDMRLIVILLSAIVFVGSGARSLLVNAKPLRFLGEISFSLYLLHFGVYYVLDAAHFGGIGPSPLVWLARLIGVFCLAVPLAYLSYRFIERPAQQFGARLIKKYLAAEPA